MQAGDKMRLHYIYLLIHLSPWLLVHYIPTHKEYRKFTDLELTVFEILLDKQLEVLSLGQNKSKNFLHWIFSFYVSL